MNNKIKGIIAIAGGLTVFVLAMMFLYSQQVRQTAGIKAQQSSAGFFGGYSRNVQAPGFTQYNTAPSAAGTSYTESNQPNTASLFFGGGETRESCLKFAEDGYYQCVDIAMESPNRYELAGQCNRYWRYNPECDGNPGTCEMSVMGRCNYRYGGPLAD